MSSERSDSRRAKIPAPADRAVTMAEIARLCGTTKMTVSRVFSGRPGVGEVLRERILEQARRLNYEVNQQASNFSSNRAGFIGLATPFEGLLGSGYFRRIVEGLTRGLKGVPHEIVLFDILDATFADGAKLERAWRQRKVDGFVALAPHLEDAFVRPLIEAGAPLVLVGEAVERASVDAVTADDESGVGLAVGHLISLGHKRIGFVGGPPSLSSARRRKASFVKEMSAAGLKVSDALMVDGDYSMRSGREAGGILLRSRKPPTAIFCANDPMAMGLIQAAASMGLKVPDDISIVGFDDLPDATECWPPLTTVHQPVDQIGEFAARMLLRRMGHEVPQIEGALKCEMRVRQSSGPLRD